MRITINIYNKPDGTRESFSFEGGAPEEAVRRVNQFTKIFCGIEISDSVKVTLDKSVNAFNNNNYGYTVSDNINVGVVRYHIVIAEGGA